jgi:hypothetical protein
MKRLMKILLGLSIGAALALLFAPKSGRKLREQLIGGATGRLLPAAPVEFPEPQGERLWDAGAATAVAEPPVVEPVIVEEATSEDLRVRIEETRAAVESDIAHPFAPVVVEEPVAEEPVAEVVEEPVVEEPVVEEPVVEEPVAEVVEEPVVEEPEAEVAEEAVAEEPVAEVVEEPVVEEPVVEEPEAEVVEEPEAEVVEEPVVEAAVVEEPVVEEPADESAAREGGTIDQAEMRRRIEETRARLKAKAFDAMMSGESALLSRDSGEKPVPQGDDIKLDGELESSIDESLSQEEY